MQLKKSTSSTSSRTRNTPKTGGRVVAGKKELNRKRYRELLGEYLPQIIETEAEYKRAMKVFDPLFSKAVKLEMAGRKLAAEEEAILNLLSHLIQVYEAKHYPIHDLPPYQTLQVMMEEQGLKQKDIVHIFGTQSRASDAISGKRPLSKAQIKALAEYFKVSTDLFI
jgi:HTH-type transcriptional regulator/antitoxin HigA